MDGTSSISRGQFQSELSGRTRRARRVKGKQHPEKHELMRGQKLGFQQGGWHTQAKLAGVLFILTQKNNMLWKGTIVKHIAKKMSCCHSCEICCFVQVLILKIFPVSSIFIVIPSVLKPQMDRGDLWRRSVSRTRKKMPNRFNRFSYQHPKVLKNLHSNELGEKDVRISVTPRWENT